MSHCVCSVQDVQCVFVWQDVFVWKKFVWRSSRSEYAIICEQVYGGAAAAQQ